MDVNKEVCKSYQQLIKALPTDILTRFVMLLVVKATSDNCNSIVTLKHQYFCHTYN